MRRLVTASRHVTDQYLPPAVGDRVTGAARKARLAQQERRRQAAGDDGAYFDQIVAAAIEEGQTTSGPR